MSCPIPSLRRPTNQRPHRFANSADEQRPDDDEDEFWDDAEPDEELQPLDDPDLEIDEEPDPDEGDFWLDPDETEDPWN